MTCVSKDRVYAYEIRLYGEVDPSRCSHAVLDLAIELRLRKASDMWWPNILPLGANKNRYLKVDWNRWMEENDGPQPEDDLKSFGLACKQVVERANASSSPFVNIVQKLNEALPCLPPAPIAARHNVKASEPHLLRVQFQPSLPTVILPGSVCYETKGLFSAMRDWEPETPYQVCEAYYEDHTCEALGECPKIHIEPREVRNYFSCYLCEPNRLVTVPTHSHFCPYAHSVEDVRIHPLMKESVRSLAPLFPPTITLKDRTVLQSSEVAPTAGAFRCVTHPESLCSEPHCPHVLTCPKVHIVQSVPLGFTRSPIPAMTSPIPNYMLPMLSPHLATTESSSVSSSPNHKTTPLLPAPQYASLAKMASIGRNATHALYSLYVPNRYDAVFSSSSSSPRRDAETSSWGAPSLVEMIACVPEAPAFQVVGSNNRRQTLPPTLRLAPYAGTVYRQWVAILAQPGFAGFEVLGGSVGTRVFWCPSALVASSANVKVYVGIREDTGRVVAVKAYKDHICETMCLDTRRALTAGFAQISFVIPKVDEESLQPFSKVYVVTELVEYTLYDIVNIWDQKGFIGTGGHVEAVRLIASEMVYQLVAQHDESPATYRREMQLSSVGVSAHGRLQWLDLGIATNNGDNETCCEDVERGSDVFAAGMLLQNLLWGPGFDPLRDSIRSDITKVLPHHAWLARDLLSHMTCVDPMDRPLPRQLLRHPFFWPLQRCVEFLGALAVLLSEVYDEASSFYDRKRFVVALADLVANETANTRWGSVLPIGFLEGFVGARPGAVKVDDAAPLELFAFVRNTLPGSHARGPHLEGCHAVTFLCCFPRLTMRCWRLLTSSPVSSPVRAHYAIAPYLSWSAPPPVPLPRVSSPDVVAPVVPQTTVIIPDSPMVVSSSPATSTATANGGGGDHTKKAAKKKPKTPAAPAVAVIIPDGPPTVAPPATAIGVGDQKKKPKKKT